MSEIELESNQLKLHLTMSEFSKVDGEVKKKWAESDSDSDNSDDDEGKESEIEIEPDSDHSDEESSSENEKLDVSLLQKNSSVVKKKTAVQLSKKEKMELRQRELSDLDAMLSELNTDSKVVVSEITQPDSVPTRTDASSGTVSKVKKSKKKKNSNKKDEEASKTEENLDISKDSAPREEIAQILKMRTKKSSSKASSNNEAQKIAINEAKKSSTASKKKKDKSKFNETSY